MEEIEIVTEAKPGSFNGGTGEKVAPTFHSEGEPCTAKGCGKKPALYIVGKEKYCAGHRELAYRKAKGHRRASEPEPEVGYFEPEVETDVEEVTTGIGIRFGRMVDAE